MYLPDLLKSVITPSPMRSHFLLVSIELLISLDTFAFTVEMVYSGEWDSRPLLSTIIVTNDVFSAHNMDYKSDHLYRY